MTHGQSAGTGDRNTGRGPGAACAWLTQEIEKESDQAPRTGRRQRTEGCWREPRPSGLAGCVRRLPRAASQNTPRAAGLRAPPHGPPRRPLALSPRALAGFQEALSHGARRKRLHLL